MTRINHNILSLTAQRNIQNAQTNLDQAIQRLSSGLRINSAWDDPAGLNISERFRSQIASVNEAERNANYAMNMSSLADGALQVINNQLVRMRSLAIQASNGPLASADRVALNQEFLALRSEISRIAQATNYNVKYLLNGDWSAENPLGIKFHVVINNVADIDYYYIQYGNVTGSALGLNSLSLLNTASAQSAITAIDDAIASKDALRTSIGSYVNRLQNTVLNHQITAESLSAAESMIRDADIAKEMSDFTRAQIMMQSGISMLTQANMVPQMVAQLIG